MLGGRRLPKKKEVGYQKKEGGRRLPKKRKDQKRKPEGLNNLGFLWRKEATKKKRKDQKA
jgi:hypothetical protein